MNDIRRTILWVIFGFSMVLLWDKWQVFNGRQATFFPSPTTQTVAGTAAPTPAAPTSTASVTPAAQPSAGAAPAVAPASNEPAVAHEQVTVTTDLLKLTFDNQGGSLVGGELLHHKGSQDDPKPFVLLEDDSKHVYVAQTGLIGGAFPTHKTFMHIAPGPRELKAGDNELTVRFESPDLGGVKLVKTYTLKRGEYAIGVRHEIVNTGAAPVAPKLYLQLVRDGNQPDGTVPFYSTFTGPAIYTGAKKYQKITFKEIKEKKVAIPAESTDGYIAMVQHYFATAWLLPDGTPRELRVDAADIGAPAPDCCYRVQEITPFGELAPGQTKAIDARLFVGPQVEKVLENLAPGLELIKDYGYLTILAKPLYWLLDKIHSVLGNWGWSIVGLVVLLKLMFYWLNAKAYSSMAKMKALNPRIQEMRTRLKDKPQQMQQEMMAIYREEKVNPLGGCLPIAIQIPVFIALYWVLLSTVEMRHAPWIGWVTDLSTKDPYFILPILMTLSTLLQTALNPAPPDPMQAKMMWIMPLAFSFMFFMFPAGLVLYWLTNNLLSIAQQWVINTRLGVPPQFHLPKFR
ncbi:MAG: membrane protein insertase YidC [Comamonas sp. SCN 65-56]|uniref:membrane protein insertase YidC n=1 Tax=Comamonas sp. SCN 65-56 TaxID=1660095 RepID=UPI00086C7D52|nr:membrane protein insertase YidC [Comamonas sp. SCN 65-56]ODS91420.1 MAG: membrane protein insertase YidC [Comamonas sp. SCN 65-56]